MAATLGGTTYSAVTWTSGDLITEAKLDAMVANDQAYDSHSAQGLLLNNNYSFASKNAAVSANYNLIKLTAGDIVQVGEDNVGDHTTINAGTSKLVKIKVLRQDDTTNTYAKDQVVLTGWGFKTGSAAINMAEDVTFGITFATAPVILASTIGVKYTSDPTSIGDQTADGYSNTSIWNVAASVVTTTGFHLDFRMETGQTFANTSRFLYGWVAIGTL